MRKEGKGETGEGGWDAGGVGQGVANQDEVLYERKSKDDLAEDDGMKKGGRREGGRERSKRENEVKDERKGYRRSSEYILDDNETSERLEIYKRKEKERDMDCRIVKRIIVSEFIKKTMKQINSNGDDIN